jgi:hypothetical protein
LLTGGISLSDDYPKIPSEVESWLSLKTWQELCRLKDIVGFENIIETIQENWKFWQSIADS